MGNLGCCGGDSIDKEVNLGAPPATKSLFDERVVLGLKGGDKLRIIIRLQALFRGHIVRK